MSLEEVALLVLVGAVSAFINTLAGGGSMLTLPALMMIGLPADLANGTNRVAVLAQSVTGAHGFDQAGQLDRSTNKHFNAYDIGCCVRRFGRFDFAQ